MPYTQPGPVLLCLAVFKINLLDLVSLLKVFPDNILSSVSDVKKVLC